jgi:hypothetical protein
MVSRSSAGRTGRRNGRTPRGELPAGAVVLDTKRYGGRWIATRRGKVMAVADSYSALDEKVVGMGIEDEVIFTHVPKSGALVY